MTPFSIAWRTASSVYACAVTAPSCVLLAPGLGRKRIHPPIFPPICRHVVVIARSSSAANCTVSIASYGPSPSARSHFMLTRLWTHRRRSDAPATVHLDEVRAPSEFFAYCLQDLWHAVAHAPKRMSVSAPTAARSDVAVAAWVPHRTLHVWSDISLLHAHLSATDPCHTG